MSAAGEARRALAETLVALGHDLTEMPLRGPRAAVATMSALAVVISVIIACAMHLPDVWWAGISGLMCSQATRPASLRKGVLRIAGTFAGAGMAFLLIPWLAYDEVACCLVLFGAAAAAVLGFSLSAHGYAWLLCGITFAMVTLLLLPDPGQGFFVATTRALEVTVGTVTAMLLALAMAPGSSAAPEPAPGWSGLFDARWPTLLHATRAGIAVACIPLLWSWFDLPEVAVMVTTLASVMAIPVLAQAPLDDEKRIIARSVQRLLGCFLGGALGLLLLGLDLTEFLPWLLALGAAIWLCGQIQTSARGTAYVGMQAGMVLVMTLVQGEGPPGSILPGINRLTGIVLGLVVLGIVGLLLHPIPPGPAAEVRSAEAG